MALTYSVQISFTSPYATPSWVDITQYVRQGSVKIGRDHELQRVVPSTLTLTLDNRDARFHTWNTAGPYWGLGGTGLTDCMPIRVQATWAGVTYAVFYGFIDAWTPKIPDALNEDVEITASDMLALLGVADLLSNAYYNQVIADAPVAYYRMGETYPSTANDATGHGHPANVSGPNVSFAVPGALLLDTDTAVDLAGQGYLQIPTNIAPSANNAFSWEMWGRLDAPVNANTQQMLFATSLSNNKQVICVILFPDGSVQFFAYDSNGTLIFNASNVPGSAGLSGLITDGKYHHIVVTYNGTAAQLYIDGHSGGVATAVSHLAFAAWDNFVLGTWNTSQFPNFNGAIDEVAVYSVALTTAQVQNHFQLGGAAYPVEGSGQRIRDIASLVGIPAGMLNIAAGVKKVQGTTASLVGTKVADYLLSVATTEAGYLFVAPNGVLTFYDRHYVITNANAKTPQATFNDLPSATYWYEPGIVPLKDNLDHWNEVVVSAQPGLGFPAVPKGTMQVVRDQTSINTSGKRSFPTQSGLLFVTDAEALELAQWLLGLYKSSAERLRSISLSSVTNAGANLPQMLGRGLWDRITVVYHGQVGGSAFQQDSLIEGIQHTFDPNQWVTTWSLSPAPNVSNYMILDSGRLDTNTVAF